MNERLRALGERLGRLTGPSDDGRFSWRRLFGRVLRTPRQPRIDLERLGDLVERIDLGYPAHLQPKDEPHRLELGRSNALRDAAERAEPSEGLLAGAVRELERNVARSEHALFVHGRLPDGHLYHLWRLYQVLHRAAEWVAQPERRTLLRELIVPDADCALSPLTTDRAYGERRPIRGVDALLDAAAAETRSLGRQRRLLEAARQQLLDAGAAVRLDPDAVRARRLLIARRITRLDRLEAAGLSPEVDLGYQLRESLHRQDLPRLFAALSALEENAYAAGDTELRQLATRAADPLWGSARGSTQDRLSDGARSVSLRISQDQLFGFRLRSAVDRGYERAAQNLDEFRRTINPTSDQALVYTSQYFDEWGRYFTARATQELLNGALCTDGTFHVGGTSSPVRAANEVPRTELVSFPEDEMVLAPVEGIHDLARAVVGDPRSVLIDLAAGKLLARRYLGRRPNVGGPRRLENEVRVYVLDGSSSMLGPRARMRDALLLSEISTLSARLQDPTRSGNPVLFYRYFTDSVGPTQRVASPEEADAAIDDILGTLREGGTDIQGALLASFEQIRLAAAEDPDLARAQIVLVTDGQASVDERRIRRAREQAGRMPIGVSIIALGNENSDLRRLAAHQRAEGERVFYQFIDDEELRSTVEGETAGLPVHLPLGAGPERLTDEVREVIAAIDRHLRRLDSEELNRGRALAAAVSELGLSANDDFSRRSAARLAALEKDRLTLETAFRRLFPAVTPPGPGAADAPPPRAIAGSPHLAEVLTALGTVAELVETFGTDAFERQADAIEIMERLLGEASVPPWAYAAIVREPPETVRAALKAVHAAARFRT